MDGPLVVFVSGWGRSGSTLVGSLLGDADGVFNAGELRAFWEVLDSDSITCGCGRAHRECDVWSAVLRDLVLRLGTPFDAAEICVLERSLVRTRPKCFWRLVRATRSVRGENVPERRYARMLRTLYRSVAQVTGAAVIVDTSKSSAHLYAASRLAGVRALVVHVVRDPRAVAYSWKRRAVGGLTYGPVGSSVHWLVNNGAVDLFHRWNPGIPYVFVRYEDLVASPVEVLSTLQDDVGLLLTPSAMIDEHAAYFHPNHTVAGNPSRFATGRVTILPDDEWRYKITIRDRLLASLPSLPLLRRYGYPIGRGRVTSPDARRHTREDVPGLLDLGN